MTFKEKWRCFREWDRKGLLIERVEGSRAYTSRGYVFDRRVFRVYALLVLACLLYIIFSAGVGWREYYVYCSLKNVDGCGNPCYYNYYQEECAPIRELERLPPGFLLGKLPSERYNSLSKGYLYVLFYGFVTAFALNHLLHNRGKSLRTILPEIKEERR